MLPVIDTLLMVSVPVPVFVTVVESVLLVLTTVLTNVNTVVESEIPGVPDGADALSPQPLISRAVKKMIEGRN